MLASINNISKSRPILIAGPTASGKSSLALDIADRFGGVIVNADALQVFADWRVLTARPSPADEARVPHHLYGHIAGTQVYSVGDWLRQVTPLLEGADRPIIVGGTGLYFGALCDGLVDIPEIPAEVRTKADAMLADDGLGGLIDGIDPQTLSRIDVQNPMRVQRAWEVQHATGRGLAAWQDETPAPALEFTNTHTILLNADRDWLNQRIADRFDQMLADGALDEAQLNHATWQANQPSAKAIGARQLMAHLDGEMTLDQVRDSVSTLTRQFAKRQRSWFRARMKGWNSVEIPD